MAKRLFYAILIIAALALPVVAGIQKGSGGGTASEVYVDNSTGGWNGDDAQAVLEEIQASIAAAATTAGVSDAEYSATDWNGVTTLAPSKNAVRDKIEAVVAALASPAAHYLTDQAEGSLSAEVVVSANGKALVTAANYAAMRTCSISSRTSITSHTAQYSPPMQGSIRAPRSRPSLPPWTHLRRE
jgi:hypothetical protein